MLCIGSRLGKKGFVLGSWIAKGCMGSDVILGIGHLLNCNLDCIHAFCTWQVNSFFPAWVRVFLFLTAWAFMQELLSQPYSLT